MGHITNLEPAAVAVDGVVIRMAGLQEKLAVSKGFMQLDACSDAYPVTANGHVQKNIKGAVAQGHPDVMVVDAVSSDLVKHPAVHVPRDALVQPVARPAIKLDSPRVPALVGNAGGAPDAIWLVADAAGEHVAVRRAISRQLPVDRLHDVELAASGPGYAAAERVAQHPKGRPYALLAVGRVFAELDGRLDPRYLAGPGRDEMVAFESAGGPAMRSRAVSPGNELQSASPAKLNIARLGRVSL